MEGGRRRKVEGDNGRRKRDGRELEYIFKEVEESERGVERSWKKAWPRKEVDGSWKDVKGN